MKKSRIRPIFTLLPLFLGVLLLCVSCPPSEPDPYIEGIQIGEKVLSSNAKRLMNYLSDNYGKNIISGQMDAAWDNEGTLDMIARVYADVNKYPAIKGFDFIDLGASYGGYGQNQIDEAIAWWDGKNKKDGEKLLTNNNIHGIITFCWHWKAGNKDFYTNNTTFRIPMKDGELDTESAAFTTIKNDLDKVAALLKQLKDKDIPVLWRPLHEAAGNYQYGQAGWFWWGASGPAAYIALWEYMYVYLAETKGLTNLIWVWNGQHAEWFPNPKSVDIVGYDRYTNSTSPQTARNYESQRTYFNNTKNWSGGNFMVALSENGAIPDPDNCSKDNAMWSWFCTWNDNQRDAWVSSNPWNSASPANYKEMFWTGEYHNTSAHKTHVYNHDKVITLDELPDLTAYRQ